MMKITGQTTLAELAAMRGKLGVTRLSLDFSPGDTTVHAVRLVVFGGERARVVTTGDTEIDALDDGFARLWHIEAEAMQKHHDKGG